VNLSPCGGVSSLLLRPRGLELLLARSDLHHHFSAHRGGALAQNLADLAHGLKLLGLLDRLFAILGADPVLGILTLGLLRILAA